MVLSDRYGGQPRNGIAKRTAKYVAGFGCGALVFSVGVSFALVALAESVLPRQRKASDPVPGQTVTVIGSPSKGSSSKRKPRTRPTSKKPTTKRAGAVDGASSDK